MTEPLSYLVAYCTRFRHCLGMFERTILEEEGIKFVPNDRPEAGA